MEFTVKFEFKASNNEAEYEALVLGMGMTQHAGASHLQDYSDSQLIVKQINGEFKAKEESMCDTSSKYRSQKPTSKASSYIKFLEMRTSRQIPCPS
ncbi:UNVERIFIED_CONTAM: hypothetical protein Sradi_4008300 [Sesamum radiatum]|uniref:RNase H type-1 domain-containing protein n=1 Tax=Sesamum radiatum TaxID=300843 RepID=A0AAW2PL97_SESRA